MKTTSGCCFKGTFTTLSLHCNDLLLNGAFVCIEQWSHRWSDPAADTTQEPSLVSSSLVSLLFSLILFPGSTLSQFTSDLLLLFCLFHHWALIGCFLLFTCPCCDCSYSQAGLNWLRCPVQSVLGRQQGCWYTVEVWNNRAGWKQTL